VTELTGTVFRIALGLHVLAGLTCVVAGIVAMLSRKGRTTHRRFGTTYVLAFSVLAISAITLALLHWPEDAYLLVFAVVGSTLVAIGYATRRVRRRLLRSDPLHLTAMGLSFITLLTAFYVDNGPHLPGLMRLPPIVFWTVPSAIGLPLVIRALVQTRTRRVRAPTTRRA
jgi:uncharacterized membrane protein